jgi:hypothetical protein
MDDIFPIQSKLGAKVAAVNNVNAQGIGDPLLVTYRVAVNFPDGVVYFDNVMPKQPRSNIGVVAARVGDPVRVWESPSLTSQSDNAIHLEFQVEEAGYFEECQPGGDVNIWTGTDPSQPPTDPNGSGGPSQPTASPPSTGGDV